MVMGMRYVRLRRRGAVRARAQALQRYIERGRRRTVLDDRPADENLGYDANGVPAAR